jgi:hypothetical protein
LKYKRLDRDGLKVGLILVFSTIYLMFGAFFQ